jgi:hypothetical protein
MSLGQAPFGRKPFGQKPFGRKPIFIYLTHRQKLLTNTFCKHFEEAFDRHLAEPFGRQSFGKQTFGR